MRLSALAGSLLSSFRSQSSEPPLAADFPPFLSISAMILEIPGHRRIGLGLDDRGTRGGHLYERMYNLMHASVC